MRLRTLFILLFVFIQAGCVGPGVQDYDVDLPGNYSIVRTSSHHVKIAPKQGDTGWGSDIIPTKVTEVGWDDNFIIAKQLGLKDDPNSSNGYQIPNENDVNYWILDYNSGDVFGPLNKENFNQSKNELGISEDVILKKVEKLR